MIKTVGLRESFHVGKGRTSSTVEAVRGIDLEATESETFGFLGPNGERECQTYSGGQRRRLAAALGVT